MMASVITDRVAASVAGAPVSVGGIGLGIIQATSVAGTDTITADTLSSITEYSLNQFYSIRPANVNTGAVTINLDGVGAVAWLKPDGTALVAGDLTPNLEYLLKYDGTAMRTYMPF